jgi:hypothetical protein
MSFPSTQDRFFVVRLPQLLDFMSRSINIAIYSQLYVAHIWLGYPRAGFLATFVIAVSEYKH